MLLVSGFGFTRSLRLMDLITHTSKKTISPVPSKATKSANPSDPEQAIPHDKAKTR
jgi:hypothetical protein